MAIFFKYNNKNIDKKVKDHINQLIIQKNREFVSLRSRTKGSLGELMTSLLYPKNERNNVVIDKIVFETPLGKRRIDNYLPSTMQAVESKNTYLSARKSIVKQIKKDAYLLEINKISELIWVCFEGASKRVQSLLKSNGILYQ